MHTYSGMNIEPGEATAFNAAPPLRDLAIGMYRACRFGGACRTWWSVLQHSLACAEFVERSVSPTGWADGATRPDYKYKLKLWALLHDAHEAVTSDVPYPYKPQALKDLQHELDERIYTYYGIPLPNETDLDILKEIDRQLVCAEGAIVGPLGITRHHTITRADVKAIDAVRAVLLDTQDDDPRKVEGAYAIKWWEDMVQDLLLKVTAP
jgi:hypothetical protein